MVRVRELFYQVKQLFISFKTVDTYRKIDQKVGGCSQISPTFPRLNLSWVNLADLHMEKQDGQLDRLALVHYKLYLYAYHLL